MSDVNMPRLSDSMEEGTILRWMKSSGEQVARGEEIAEIETDKATMAYEADIDGVLEIVAEEGATLPVGELIARIGGNGPSEREAENGASSSDGDGKRAAADPSGGPRPPTSPADESDGDPSSEPDEETSAPTPDQGGGSERRESVAEGDRVKASPLARRIAEERGVDLHAVAGSGPGGRVVKSDVEGAGPSSATSAPASAAGEQGTAKGEVTIEDPTRTQQLVARRMAESKALVPEFTLTTRIEMDNCVALRTQFKELETEVAPSYNDMVVRACAVALRELPRANGSFNRDGKFELYSRVNVGIAVAAPNTLVVPTIFDADQKSLGAIARDAKALAERVRSGEITPPELSGGTFTVSNLGMFGVSEFTAVINTPQAAILAVGKMEETAVVRDGEIVVRQVMAVTLTSDHRILYGADAAQFLARVKTLLEAPASLML